MSTRAFFQARVFHPAPLCHLVSLFCGKGPRPLAGTPSACFCALNWSMLSGHSPKSPALASSGLSCGAQAMRPPLAPSSAQ
eukprot:4900284-Pyramimonas_sp.AAC.1